MQTLQETTYLIGVDVGGTNTDSVLVNYINGEIVAFHKTLTTLDISTGVQQSIEEVIKKAQNRSKSFESDNIVSIIMGTTQFLNSLVQRKELIPVSVARVCGHKSRQFPPFINFPPDLKKIVNNSKVSKVFFLSGGREITGKQISQLNITEIREKAIELCKLYKDENIEKQYGVLSLVISGIFSNLDMGDASNNHEQRAMEQFEKIFQEHQIKYEITLSSEIASSGLLQREGVAILNGALKQVAFKVTRSLGLLVQGLKLQNCKNFFLTGNDGNLVTFKEGVKWPVKVLASGATNSARGACLLEKKHQALICDIGGSTTDFAIIENGEPKPSPSHIYIGGVLTNLSMPDTYSIAMGGGSIVDKDNGSFGSELGSVALNLTTQSLFSGGSIITLTDIVLANDPALWQHFDKSNFPSDLKNFRELQQRGDFIQGVIEKVLENIQNAIYRFIPSNQEVDLILVGGGRILVPQGASFKRIKGKVKRHGDVYGVINSYGAALAKISSHQWRILNFQSDEIHDQDLGQNKIQLQKFVENMLLEQGAVEETIQCLEPSESRFPYTGGTSSYLYCKGFAEYDHAKPKFESIQSYEQLEVNYEDKEETYLCNESVQEEVQVESISETEHIRIQPQFEFDEKLDTWVWVLSELDFEAICLGSEYLGSGGGGSTLLPKLQLKALKEKYIQAKIKSHPLMRIISPEMNQSMNSKGTLVFSAGSPSVVGEVLLGVTPAIALIDKIKEKFKIDFLICAEIGGMNGVNPLLVSLLNGGLPVLDADSMGRAFPSLDQFTHIYRSNKQNLNLVPHLVADDSGIKSQYFNQEFNSLEVLRPLAFQRDLREKCYYSSVNVHGIMTIEEAKRILVQNSYSRAWRLGKSIIETRSIHRELDLEFDVFQSQELGQKVFEGVVSKIDRRWCKDNHAQFGEIYIESFDSQNRFIICFQNEYLVVLEMPYSNQQQINIFPKPFTIDSHGRQILEKELRVMCTTPDIIVLLNYQDLSPILIEKIRLGVRVKCYTFPVDIQLRDETGLQKCSPKNFGFQLDYKTMIDYTTVPQEAASIFEIIQKTL